MIPHAASNDSHIIASHKIIITGQTRKSKEPVPTRVYSSCIQNRCAPGSKIDTSTADGNGCPDGILKSAYIRPGSSSKRICCLEKLSRVCAQTIPAKLNAISNHGCRGNPETIASSAGIKIKSTTRTIKTEDCSSSNIESDCRR